MSPRLRIGMLGAFPPQSQGVKDYCGALAGALSSRYDVIGVGFSAMYPAWLYPGESSPVDLTKPIADGPHLSVQHPLTYYNVWTWLRVAASLQVDVFHAQWWSLPLWPVTRLMMWLMRRRRKRIVLTVHNVLPHDRSRWFVAAGRSLCRAADAVVVHSPENREPLRRWYNVPEEKIHEAAHGIFFSTASRLDAAASKRALGLADSASVLLLFGALRPYKGIDVLLRAFGSMAVAFPDLQVVIAGKLWVEWEPYQRLVEEFGLEDRVHCVFDYVPDREVPTYFSAADLVVLPYTSFEAQSGVAATAVPYETPMIVSRTGGLPQWVGRDEAWIVEPGDAEELATRLVDFFENRETRKNEFRRIARRVQETGGWEAVLDAYGPIYSTDGREPS